jgi:hypothetical protein
MGSFYRAGVPMDGNLSQTIGGKTDKISFKGSEVQEIIVNNQWSTIDYCLLI